MVDIIIILLFNFLFFFLLFLIIGALSGRHWQWHIEKIEIPGQRTFHSNLNLVNLLLLSFLIFPLIYTSLLTEEQDELSKGYLYVFGFLLTGAISYFYFIRICSGEKR